MIDTITIIGTMGAFGNSFLNHVLNKYAITESGCKVKHRGGILSSGFGKNLHTEKWRTESSYTEA